MEISWYIILNIFSIFIIKGCKGIQEKDYRNLINPNAETENYISVNISSHNAPNNFHIISTELSGVDTTLIIPKPGIKIGEILDQNISLWKRTEDQKFILAMFSTSSHRTIFIINLIIKCSTGIKYVTYLHKSDDYESISILQYLDRFSMLRPIYSPKNFTLDLEKVNTPEIIDINTKIGQYKVNLFIPYRKYRANRVKFGKYIIFDGSSDNRHMPIAIGYVDHGKTYINMFISEGDDNFGYIYKYQLCGLEFKFISKSDKKPIFDIFTHQIGKLSVKTNVKSKDHEGVDTTNVRSTIRSIPVETKSSRPYSFEDIDIPRISLDLSHIESQFIKTEIHKVMYMETIKFLPIGAIIISVSFDGKPLWTATEDEIKCVQINIHSVKGQKRSIELSIQNKIDKVVNRIIPYDSITSKGEYEDTETLSATSTPLKEFAEVETSSDSDEDIIDNEVEQNVVESTLDKEEENIIETKVAKDTEKETKNVFVPKVVINDEEDSEDSGVQTPPPSPNRRRSHRVKIPKPQYAEVKPSAKSSEDIPIDDDTDTSDLEDFELKPSTPPNSPARTPPPSPARGSISDEPLSEIDLERIRASLFKPINDSDNDYESETSTTDESIPKETRNTFYVEPDHLEAVSNEEDYSNKYQELYGDKIDEPEVDRRTSVDSNEVNSNVEDNEIDKQDKKEKKSENLFDKFDKGLNEFVKNSSHKSKKSKKTKDITDSLDISSKESIQKMHIVDGTPIVPFILLYSREEYPIRSIYDGRQCIWKNINENQIIRYVSLYIRDKEPIAIAIMIFDRPGIKYKYFMKDMGDWFEVSTNDYDRATQYEFKKPQSETTQESVDSEGREINKLENKEVEDENVLHVSIMVPVILGTLFLLLWVGSMLFIIFFL